MSLSFSTEIEPKYVAVSFSSNPVIAYSDGEKLCEKQLASESFHHTGCVSIGGIRSVAVVGDRTFVQTDDAVLLLSKGLRISRKIKMKREPKAVAFYRDGFVALFDDKACLKGLMRDEKTKCIQVDSIGEVKSFARHEMKKGIVFIREDRRIVDVDLQRFRVFVDKRRRGELVAVENKSLAVYSDEMIEVGRLTSYGGKDEFSIYGIMKPYGIIRNVGEGLKYLFFVCNTVFPVFRDRVLAVNLEGYREVFPAEEEIIAGAKNGKNLILATKKRIYVFVRSCRTLGLGRTPTPYDVQHYQQSQHYCTAYQ